MTWKSLSRNDGKTRHHLYLTGHNWQGLNENKETQESPRDQAGMWKHGTTPSSLLGNPYSPGKLISGRWCHHGSCCSILSLPSQLVASATPPFTEARVCSSCGTVSLRSPKSPAKLSGPCKFSWHFLPAPRCILPVQSACSSRHSKHPSGSSVPLQASSKRFPGGSPSLNEAIAVPLIYTRTDTRLKMEASFRITINKRCPFGGWSWTPKLISSRIMTVINNSPKGCCTSKMTPF